MPLPDRRTILLAGLASTLAAGGARAAFPERPIQFVVPFAPAGGTDIAARRLGETLARQLGQSVIIDNRPGANGIVAGQAVVKAPADGHMLLIATAASFAAAPALGQKLPYDVAYDFAPVGMLGLFPLVLNASPTLPVNSLAEFIAYARQRPGQLNFASAGVGGTNHLVFEMIMQAAGLKLAHVPYRGAGLAAADLMSGQVQVMIDSLAASLGNIQGGKLKALAVTTDARQPQLPELPTLREQGVDLIYPGWASIVAPAGIAPDTLHILNTAINTAMADAELVARYRELVIEPVAWSPQETGAFMARDRAILTELVAKTGIRLTE
ncbi:Tripartite-type tricarboxylate transporter, receptor component TctC [Bosea sp. 62]|uniref:Bug family tripartite tricarboxylate transporter substrate binding protein n=1 Tax=unclassified Bosea (in: a-proteobacteria) TaxID=2653178 RepID=UPI00125302A8|nr:MULTISPECIES: tripartite tricarboxylate transporter substrate binding protein [unclassified Bosea (in: a-proteobacteria)]CAD5255100.1 Tripartite-type tricarboxylate transporter, receptor component TctC [Bosea sp. 21B]CAD5285221.1 Tripartite-type tricarboxylate transporter, receptor component TctC [Bosea sp. 7B]CAD5301570.1 Tripartite-type tricarboxylate transporter, receptor component TctC [Bosea sp. 46]VVT57687.1 Tripartite-type tricarboxylate transporter, receptor component TctC [Bosea sp.